MPRTARASIGNICYHVFNCGNAQNTVFHNDDDYASFLGLLSEANQRIEIRLLSYCLMPDHFQLVVWPIEDRDLSRWMQWLMTAHVRRYHRNYKTSGHVWQGRFKAFPIQSDNHLLTVMRYVERNPVRAKSIPVRKAQNWRWSSIGTPPKDIVSPTLHPGPVRRREDWLEWVNQPLIPEEIEAIQVCINRGQPYGNRSWKKRTAKSLGIESSIRPRGRPRKKRRASS